jgi:hypothetical protein
MLARRTESSRPRILTTLPALALVAIATASAHAGAIPSADELIDKSTKAMGGKAVEKVESYMATADMTAPMGTMTSEIYWAKPDLVFAKQGIPQMGEITMATDGKIGWTHNPMMGGYALLEGKEREELIEQAIHIRLMHLRETAKQNFNFKGVTEAEFDGARCFELAFVGKEADSTEDGSIFFEADSGLIRGMNVNDGGDSVTILLKDWKEIDGVRFFHRMELAGGPMAFTVTYTKIEVNKVDPSVFAVPDEVKELAKKQVGKSGDEMAIEDFSPQMQSVIKSMMDNLPWDNLQALKQARQSIASQGSSPGEVGKAMTYVLKRVDAALAGGG